MKFSSVLTSLAIAASTAVAAPVDTNAINITDVPAEAVIGYLDFDGADDIAILPFNNSTSNGLMFVNTTIVESAYNDAGVTLGKRNAQADAWHWLRLAPGQPLYKRSAEADADAWHWLRLAPGQPLYKRDAEADADAEAWHWLRLAPGQPLYKRDAEADADAEAWHWLRLAPGQPLY